MKKKNKKEQNIKCEESSGNVFADLGLLDPDVLLAKAELAYQINTLINEKQLTQSEAAELLGIDQPKISYLNRGRLAGFSLERLFRFLNILGKEININVIPLSSNRTKYLTVSNLSSPKSSKNDAIKKR